RELLKNSRGAEIFSGSNFGAQNFNNCGQNLDKGSCNANGITLIALIITIVIMLILAGITINLTLGENGIFLKAKDAKQNYEIASLKDQIQMDLSNAETKLLINGGTVTNGQIAATLSKYGTVNFGTGDDINKVTGFTVNGRFTAIEDVWSGVQEVKWSINGENKNVNAVLDTEGVAVPVPTGFHYVGGTVDTGVVISDNESDKDKYRTYSSVPSGYSYENDIDGDETTVAYLLEGNQFVWVPVTGGIENARSDFCTNKNYYGNFADCIDVFDAEYRDGTATHRTEPTRTLSFDNDSSTLANYDAMKTSVNNYGGFYVARYEASTSDFAGNSGKTSGATAGNVLSKANGKPWDAINQAEAKAKCEAMYNDSSSVKSLLMSSYTWDATLSFIQNKGDKKNVSKDSTTWGNYFNRRGVKDKITFTGNYINATWSWGTIGTFNSNNTWTNGTDVSSAEMSNYLKLGTGTSESTKANNIYDIAGNLWEWTTEISNTAGSNVNNRVLRGGSCYDHGSDRVASHRFGNDSVTDAYTSVGFRPQLFIQM
ncbi:MAG: SUMF1/EgtB/PvdO family nonheme iron enzyme, partial [Clostridia bacterium]|nr:SUMF1/EgtB/PvdO family nonheme iron enzyme [Clostridia bacterium]